MKKVLFFITILCLVLSVFLVSCENNHSAKDSTATTTTATGNAGVHSHTYGEWVVLTEATCVQEGKRVRVCECKSEETETLARVDHSYVGAVCSMCKQKDPSVFVPDCMESEYNVIGSDDAAMNITSQGRYIYYSNGYDNGNEIHKFNKIEYADEKVYSVAGHVSNVNVVGDWIYFYCMGSTLEKCYIAKVRTDGSHFEKLVSGICISEMLVVKDTVYYTLFPQDAHQMYTKYWLSLYSISTDGGASTLIYDGVATELAADDTHLYFIHEAEDGKMSLCRIEHESKQIRVLLDNTDVFAISIENTRVYFLFKTPTNINDYTLASISVTGDDYTVHHNCLRSQLLFFHVIGNKVYYRGYTPDGSQNGFMEFDLESKTFMRISRVESNTSFAAVFDRVAYMFYENEELDYVEIYTPETRRHETIEPTE